MILYQSLREALREHIAAQTEFASPALVQLDDGSGTPEFEAALSQSGGIAVSILPIYAVDNHEQIGIAPNVVVMGKVTFVVELATPPTTSEEDFSALVVALFGALSNAYWDTDDQHNPVRVIRAEMSPGNGLRAFNFECEKFVMMTPINIVEE